MPTESVKVAAIQCRSIFGDVARNLDTVSNLIHSAADRGAKIVVTPEVAIPGYASDDLRTIWRHPAVNVDPWFETKDVLSVAEPIPGLSTRRLATLAKERKIWLLAGLIERGESDRAYNAAVLFSPDGEIAALYRKRWPWPAIEPAWATPGDTPAVLVPTPFGPLGVTICYDIHHVRRLYQPGQLWTLLFPAAWVDRAPPAPYFDQMFPRIARTFGCNIIFANRRSNPDSPWLGSGESTIYGEDGQVIARSPHQFEDDVVIATISAMK